jgi:glycosyltransferase involved in cell wall biosynthesis
MIENPEDRQCSLYLLHGDMTDEEIHSLYEHPNINALLALTHGEGFGLPLYEAAYTGIPVIAAGWSGHLDFLVDEKGKEHFYSVAYDLNTIPEEAVWDTVLLKESMWAYPREQDAKLKMRECYKELTGEKSEEAIVYHKEYAQKLREKFSEEKMYEQFASLVYGEHIDVNSWLAQLDDEIEEHE